MTDNNDPFGPFKAMMEQFAPSDSNDLPGAGFPMVPFPATGMGGLNQSLSPEANTQSAVRQLYTAIEELGGSSGTMPGNLWQQYQEMFDLDTSSWSPDRFWSYTMNTYQIWLHSLAQLLVEVYSLRLIHDELVVESHRHSTKTQEWLWSLSQSDREELLLRCTDVEEDLVGDMRAARERRNELLYDIGSWEELDFEAPVEDARVYMRVLDELDDLVMPGSGFQYLPGTDSEEGGEGSEDQDDSVETDDSADSPE
jgi:hypothetical protein